MSHLQRIPIAMTGLSSTTPEWLVSQQIPSKAWKAMCCSTGEWSPPLSLVQPRQVTIIGL